MDTISLKLGHRLALDWARLPDSVKPGGILRLRFAVRNHGFGELFNPRDVEAVLYREGRLEAAVLPVDPRRWSGGSADTVEVSLSVPAYLPEGAWRLGLRLADRDTALREGSRAIPSASPMPGYGTPPPGINDLKADLVVSLRAPGARDPAATRFAVVGGGVRVRSVPVGRGGGGLRLEHDPAGRLVISLAGSGKGARAGEALPVRLRRLDGSIAAAWRIVGAGGAGGEGGKVRYALPVLELPKGVHLLEADGPRGRAAWRLLAR